MVVQATLCHSVPVAGVTALVLLRNLLVHSEPVAFNAAELGGEEAEEEEEGHDQCPLTHGRGRLEA